MKFPHHQEQEETVATVADHRLKKMVVMEETHQKTMMDVKAADHR